VVEKSPIRAAVLLKDINPDEWKNIPLPLIDAIKALMAQVGALTYNEGFNVRQTGQV
jgi:hypothetical protein